MKMHRMIAVGIMALAAALPAAGCATSRAADGVGDSIPSGPSPLSGTWYGSAHEVVRDGNPPYVASYVLRINDDGTVTLKAYLHRGGSFEYSGTASVRGNRVILSETNGSRWVSLKSSGRTLYAVIHMGSWRLTNSPVAIEFHRAEDGS